MAKFEKFGFAGLKDLRGKIAELNVDIQLSEDLAALRQPVRIGGKMAPNALAALPMEGCDSNADGSPSELVTRRYTRFAEGGAGLLWAEACAVAADGRANPLQMYLTRDNLPQFKKLVAMIRSVALAKHGHVPVTILQLTHSGRYSRPWDFTPAPLIAQHDPLLDPRVGVEADSPVLCDDYLDELQGKYVASALLAQEAGFDGVDIKACHRYLVSELLASHVRDGRYGGSYENRTRFLRDVVRKVRKACGGDFLLASRFNAYDAHPYPYGFGVDREDRRKVDLAEPLQLVRDLVADGVDLLSGSTGNPYFRFPQVTRPFDMPVEGGEMPDEHPLESIERLFGITAQIKESAGGIPVVGSGYTWLRQFFPHAGSANIERGRVSFVGIGRLAFAYPDAPADILRGGALNPGRVCIACSKCTQMMRDGTKAGCVVRDAETYASIYKAGRADAIARSAGRSKL